MNKAPPISQSQLTSSLKNINHQIESNLKIENINSILRNILIDNKYFITFFVTVFVIYFLPLKHKDIEKNKISFAMGIKFI